MKDQTKVVYPKNKINGKPQIIYCGDFFTIAIINWDGTDRVAMRWNGEGDSKGYPKGLFGHPQWFIMPKDIAISYLKDIVSDIKIVEQIQVLADDCP